MRTDYRFMLRPFLAALVLCGLATPIASGKEKGPPSEAANPLDPRQYLSISWNEEPLVRPCTEESCPPAWEIVGGGGKLHIDFDRQRMKELWKFDTRGSLSVRGYVDSAANGRRNIEIPGYSLIGTELNVVEMDLSAAFDLVSQLSQAILLADRVKTAAKQANKADLEAQRTAIEKLIAADSQVLYESELALRRIYTEALRFTLTIRDVEDAAQAVAKAKEARAAVEQPDAAGLAAKLETFFREVSSERETINAWLDELLAEANRPYFPIIARIVGRSENVIRDVAKEVQNLFNKQATGELTPEAQDAAMRRIRSISEILLGIQDNVFLYYQNMNSDGMALLQGSPLYHQRLLSNFDVEDIKTAEKLYEECGQGKPEQYEPDPKERPGVKDNAAERAVERLQALDVILEKLTGPSRYVSVKQQVLDNFTKQIDRDIKETKKLLEKWDVLSQKIWHQEQELKQRKEARKNCRDKLVKQGHNIETLLMIEIINTLIDAIPPVTLSLDDLDLDDGDRLGIVVSLLPRPKPNSPPPPQLTCEFRVSSFGWSGSRPRIRDVLTFVQADAPGRDFAPRPGVTALWNFYGKSPKQKSVLRALAPGFGISASFLDFDDMEDSIEVGLGLTFSLFDDLLHLTYGYNLQKELSGSTDQSREYFGIGISLTQVVNKFKKDE